MTTIAQRARWVAPGRKGTSPVQFQDGGTPEQRDHWTETDFNWHLREALKQQGYRATHIRETDEPGKADVLVYSQELGSAYPDRPTGLTVINAWLELKIDNDVGTIRAGQKQFMRDHWTLGHNAMFVMRDRKTAMIVIRQGDLKGRTMTVLDNPYRVNWQEVFQAFKSRR